MRYLFILFLPFLFVQPVMAVPISELDTFNDVVLTIDPKYPKPGDALTASLQSYSHNLQGMDIRWSIDGASLGEGTGLTTTSLRAPKLGESIELSAEIKDLVTIKRVITPITVDILWEAQTYTDKRYLGRALPVDGSEISALAIPHLGKTNLATTKLIYNWYKDGRFLIKDSGVNRSQITTNSPGVYSRYNLNVEITDLSGAPLGRSGVTISSVEPELVLYRLSPLIGTIFYKSLSNSSSFVDTKESGVIAIPYYFSILNPNVLRYKWQSYNMNIAQDSTSEPQSVTILESIIGSVLSVSARHRDILLQSAKAEYSVIKDKLRGTSGDEQGEYMSPFGSQDSI